MPFRQEPDIAQAQGLNACGPTSLSSCLFLLGFEATPRQLFAAAGKRWPDCLEGADEHDLERAAQEYGARCESLLETDKTQGPAFAKKLLAHIRRGLPAILSVQDTGHWVAVVGHLGGKFLIMDPNDGDHTFNRWGEAHFLRSAWNEPDSGEPPQFFALLLRRADGASPTYRLTKALARLCEVGSEQTTADFASDLRDLARRAGPAADGDAVVPLVCVLAQHKETILGAIRHWTASDAVAVSYRAVRALYGDYLTVAAATGVCVGASASHEALVAQLTAILTTYAWTGEL